MLEKPESVIFQTGKILLIDKELDWTSFDVVNKIRIILNKRLGIKKIKVGHAGTLDPLAIGLVLVCTGKATKKISSLQSLEKEYIATIKFGESTPSFDLETEIDRKYPFNHISINSLKEVLESYTGIIEQVPPDYSAKYVKGKRAYELARKGEKIELKPNQVKIVSIELLDFDLPFIKLKIICGKGTYVRSLVRDLAAALNSGAYLTELQRTRIGEFTVDKSMKIEDFENSLSLL